MPFQLSDSAAAIPTASAHHVTASWLRRGGWILCAIWFAALASLGEIALSIRAALTHVRVEPIQFTLWIPIGYLILTITAGAVLVLATRRASPRRTIALLLGALACLASFGVLAGTHKLSVWTSLLIAAGVAARTGAMAANHSDRARRAIVKTLPVLALLMVSAPAWTALTHRAALNKARGDDRPLPNASSPNVLLIVLDTVRASSLHLYGYERAQTPMLDRLGGRGVVFENALSTAPWTLPSHGSLFTGRLPHEVGGALTVPLNSDHPTLAEILSAQGYDTAGFAANTFYGGAEFGLSRGFGHYEDRDTTLPLIMLETSAVSAVTGWFNLGNHLGREHKFGIPEAASINQRFLMWMSRRDSSRPFFAFLNYFDAHAPYLSPEQFAAEGIRYARPTLKPMDQWSADEVRLLNHAYDRAIAYLDSQLARLFEDLDRNGTLSNTLVIVTADHGEQFGEHGLIEHAASLYLPLLHVPLIISYPPHVPAGRTVREYVSLKDVAATILEMTGAANRLPGTSLSRHWSGATVAVDAPLISETDKVWAEYPDWYPARQGRMRSLVAHGSHYIRNYGSGREELYDLAADPDELHDLSAVRPEITREYRRYLEPSPKTPVE